jgi:nucleotide-binding universal stress UspA family protein
MSIKKILVPVDFSQHSEYAAEMAADLARKNNAELYLLHALDIPVYEENWRHDNYQNFEEGLFLMKRARKRFDEFKSKEFFKGVRVVEAVQFQNTYELIAELADKHKIDLIVMGSKGVGSGLKGYFLGSNTEKVIRFSNVPVITVKQKYTEFNPQNVVFVTDFTENHKRIIEATAEVLSGYNPNYYFLRVITPSYFETTETTNKKLETFMKGVSVKGETIVYNSETVEEGIIEFNRLHKTDLCVMGTYARKGLSHLIFGSITEDVANKADFMVMSVKLEE